MNKLTLFTLLFFAISLANAQNEKITQKLDNFTEVKAFDGLSVNLIKSTKNEAVITGANTQKVAIINNEGVLKLRMELDKIFSGYRTFIDLYYTDNLTVIDVNEDARISSNETIKQDLLELKSQEGGELIIDAQVTQLLVKSVTGGVITSNGFAKNQDIKINTGGIYYGKNFETELTTISVNAGGNAEINATNYVQATVKAGGEVLVYGDPAKMDEKTVFGGKIIRK